MVPKGGFPTKMERITFSVPTLFADHHVKHVRKALLSLPGVTDVIASSMYRDVTVDYDPAKVPAADIRKAVEDAGYPIGAGPELAPLVPSKDDGSPWYMVQRRRTTTVMLDREMAGDFRKY